jgi:VWFA-related protein
VTLAGLLSQAQTPERTQPPTFGSSTEMVYVRFHVEKKGGRVETLDKDAIRVLEDGRPQAIALFETPSTRERSIAPEVTLALDVSSSVMDAKLLDEALLKQVFLAGLSEQATIGLCAFGGELKCFTPPTRDVQALMHGYQEAIFFSGVTRHQGTRLYASLADLCKAPEGTAAEQPQRALVVFSDGIDNHGGKVKDAADAAALANVRVYAVKLGQAFRRGDGPSPAGGGFGGSPNRALYDYKKFDLDALADESGGRAYEPGTLDRKALADILHGIATEIRTEYVVGYQPEGAATGKRRRVKVELVDKALGTIRDGERTLLR